MQAFKRMITWLVAPRSVNGKLLAGQAGGVGDVLWFLLVILLGVLPAQVVSAAMTYDRGILSLLIQLAQLYMGFVIGPMASVLLLGLGLAIAARIKGKKASVDGLMAAASYLVIPVGLMALAGALWTQWIGAQRVLPNVSIGSFLRSQPAWWEWALRILLAYGPSAWFGFVLLRQVFSAGEEKRDAAPALAKKRVKLAAVFSGALLLAALGSGAVYVSQHWEQLRPIRVGDQAPSFHLPRADGKGKVSLKSLRGKPVLIEFWATWCHVCVGHMPELDRWAGAHPKLQVLGIAQGETAEEVQAYVTGKGFEHITYLVDEHHFASRRYKATTLPTFFLLGPDGRVRAARVGALPDGWLDEHLAAKKKASHAGHQH